MHMTKGTNRALRLAGAALIAGLLAPPLAWAQQGQGERTGVGGRPATSAQPNLGPSTPGRSGTDDCDQASQVGSNCSPSSVGDQTRSRPGPAGGDTGAPMSGSTGSTGTSATPGGNQRSPSDPSGAR
jgi:hypothetical protein